MGWMDKFFYSSACAAVYRDPDDWPRESSSSFNFGLDSLATLVFFAMSVRILYFIFTCPLQKEEGTSAFWAVAITIVLCAILPHEVIITASWITFLLVFTCKEPEEMKSGAKFAMGASTAWAVLVLFCGTFDMFRDTYAEILVVSVCVIALAKVVRATLDSVERQAEEDFQKTPLLTPSSWGFGCYKGESDYPVWNKDGDILYVAKLSSAKVVTCWNEHYTVTFDDYAISSKSPKRVLPAADRRSIEFVYFKDREKIYLQKPKAFEVRDTKLFEALRQIFWEAYAFPKP